MGAQGGRRRGGTRGGTPILTQDHRVVPSEQGQQVLLEGRLVQRQRAEQQSLAAAAGKITGGKAGRFHCLVR